MMALISQSRTNFHKALLGQEVITLKGSDQKLKKRGIDLVASNADSSNAPSSKIAYLIAKKLEASTGSKLVVRENKQAGQTLGSAFESICTDFLNSTFSELKTIRPGNWTIEKVNGRSESILGKYEQYSHLAILDELTENNKELKSFLGDGYTIAPDVIIARKPEPDATINAESPIVDNSSCFKAMLRESNHPVPSSPQPLLHASVSCKFTMRSDRSQNTRTEALNLLRSRKGRAPHIVSVTAEPLPSRLASLALGTGDIDCVYHAALYELKEALEELEMDDALELLNVMIEGKRLKDISDLPLDLAV